MQNILDGVIWFCLPVLLVCANDTWAYICGFFLGKRFINQPLTKLSVKSATVSGLGNLSLKNRIRDRFSGSNSGCSAVWFTIVNLVHNFVNLVHNPVNLVHNFYKILKKSSQRHPMTFIRENLVSRKMHALRAVIWRNLRVLLVRRKLSNCEPGSQNCEPGSQFRIVNQTALHP